MFLKERNLVTNFQFPPGSFPPMKIHLGISQERILCGGKNERVCDRLSEKGGERKRERGSMCVKKLRN
jgi:hypothetical protein